MIKKLKSFFLKKGENTTKKREQFIGVPFGNDHSLILRFFAVQKTISEEIDNAPPSSIISSTSSVASAANDLDTAAATDELDRKELVVECNVENARVDEDAAVPLSRADRMTAGDVCAEYAGRGLSVVGILNTYSDEVLYCVCLRHLGV
jgi:hypothetical protein